MYKLYKLYKFVLQLQKIYTVETRYRTASQSGPPRNTDNLFRSQIFPHSHNVLSDSESGPTRDSGHGLPFFSPKS